MEIPLLVRAIHLVAAALWLGAAAILTVFVMPATRRSGPAGGAVHAEAMSRGLGAYMASVAGLTVLSGGWLYWIYFHAVGEAAMRRTGGLLLTLGALCGVAALVIGGAVISRVTKELATLAGAAPDDATRARIAVLQQRGATASRIALILILAAMLLMIVSRWY